MVRVLCEISCSPLRAYQFFFFGKRISFRKILPVRVRCQIEIYIEFLISPAQVCAPVSFILCIRKFNGTSLVEEKMMGFSCFTSGYQFRKCTNFLSTLWCKTAIFLICIGFFIDYVHIMPYARNLIWFWLCDGLSGWLISSLENFGIRKCWRNTIL